MIGEICYRLLRIPHKILMSASMQWGEEGGYISTDKDKLLAFFEISQNSGHRGLARRLAQPLSDNELYIEAFRSAVLGRDVDLANKVAGKLEDNLAALVYDGLNKLGVSCPDAAEKLIKEREEKPFDRYRKAITNAYQHKDLASLETIANQLYKEGLLTEAITFSVDPKFLNKLATNCLEKYRSEDEADRKVQGFEKKEDFLLAAYWALRKAGNEQELRKARNLLLNEALDEVYPSEIFQSDYELLSQAAHHHLDKYYELKLGDTKKAERHLETAFRCAQASNDKNILKFAWRAIYESNLYSLAYNMIRESDNALKPLRYLGLFLRVVDTEQNNSFLSPLFNMADVALKSFRYSRD